MYLLTIQGELGAGAAGIVYKAAHKTTGEEVGKYIVKLRQGSGKDRQGMALKAKGLKA